jgi:pectinesterase
VSQQRQALQYSFTVAADGFGDFTTVQAAINAVPDYRKNPPRSS